MQTLLIYHLTLIVRYVIVFQQIFADIKVVAFNLALGVLYGAINQLVLYGFPRLATQLLHHAAHIVVDKNAHQVVVYRQVKPARTWVPLAA